MIMMIRAEKEHPIYLCINKMYPTKKEILENPPNNIKDDILILEEWKSINYKGWKEKKTIDKHEALYNLINELSKMHGHHCEIQNTDEENYYDNEKHTINISKNNPSIISALHEFGHHLYGESELKACSYSIWLYKLVFPKMYAKMNFEGHLLKMKK